MYMKKIIITSLMIGLIIASSVLQQGCTVTKITERGGAQLWSENCTRCHSTPPPNVYSDEQWDVISTHMRVRAAMTNDETEKIIEFIKSANK
jgi:cytochrome c1